jgi:hypothetical protein
MKNQLSKIEPMVLEMSWVMWDPQSSPWLVQDIEKWSSMTWIWGYPQGLENSKYTCQLAGFMFNHPHYLILVCWICWCKPSFFPGCSQHPRCKRGNWVNREVEWPISPQNVAVIQQEQCGHKTKELHGDCSKPKGLHALLFPSCIRPCAFLRAPCLLAKT